MKLQAQPESWLELALSNPYSPHVIAGRREARARSNWPQGANAWISWWESLPAPFQQDEAALVACFVGTESVNGIRDAQTKIERRARNALLKSLLDPCAEVACRALRVSAALDAIVGNTDVMREVRRLAWAAAFGERLDNVNDMRRLMQTTPVLIEGATGTGKELVARALCLSMPGAWNRKDGWTPAPTESVHLASLPSTLVESALFGHEKGAYSGAHKDRPGVFERCHGGVVFLDEIAELPVNTQVALLRTLQEGKTRRLGASVDQDAAPRIVSATHKDLEQLVSEDRFRLDLLYRLSSVTISLPPLVERHEDIPLLFEKEAEHAAPSARHELRDKFDRFLNEHPGYQWPGNVRELHAVVRALALGLQPRLKKGITKSSASKVVVPAGLANTTWTLRDTQRWYCARAVEKVGTQSGAADVLDIDRGTLRAHLVGNRDE